MGKNCYNVIYKKFYQSRDGALSVQGWDVALKRRQVFVVIPTRIRCINRNTYMALWC